VSIRPTRVTHAVTVTVGAMAIAPAVANATPSLTTDRSRYAETGPIQFSSQGFTTNGDVSFIFAANGRLGTASTKADVTGAFQYTVGAPKLKSFDADAGRGAQVSTAIPRTIVDRTGRLALRV
jgi:hypothetical protein